MQIMVKELFIDWATHFQTPYMGFSKTVEERMYKKRNVCFNILTTSKQSDIENAVLFIIMFKANSIVPRAAKFVHLMINVMFRFSKYAISMYSLFNTSFEASTRFVKRNSNYPSSSIHLYKERTTASFATVSLLQMNLL